MKSRNWKPTISMPFSSTRFRGIRGIVARRVADGHEAAAVAERAQRRLRQGAAHRVDHDIAAARAGSSCSAAGGRSTRWSISRAAPSVRGDRELLGRRGHRGHRRAEHGCRAARRRGRHRRRRRARSARRRAARRPTDRRTWYAVRCATPNAAATRRSVPGGTRQHRGGGRRPPRRTRRRSPSRSPRSPTATPSTPVADPDDRAGELAARHERRRHLTSGTRSRSDEHVGEVHRRGVDGDADLARTDLGSGDLDDLHLLGLAVRRQTRPARQRPRQTGSRRSTKAVAPSMASSLPNTTGCHSLSRSLARSASATSRRTSSLHAATRAARWPRSRRPGPSRRRAPRRAAPPALTRPRS